MPIGPSVSHPPCYVVPGVSGFAERPKRAVAAGDELERIEGVDRRSVSALRAGVIDTRLGKFQAISGYFALALKSAFDVEIRG